MEHKRDRIKVYEIFTGVSVDIWNEPHEPALFLNMDLQLNFISELPAGIRPDVIHRGGEFYDVPNKLIAVKYGKYSDLLTLYQAAGSDDLKIWQNTPLMIAIFACVDYETDEELKEIGEEIKQMPADEAYSLASFFLTKLKKSNHGTKTLVQKLKMIPHILRQASIYFLVGLVLVFSFIRWPKEILPSVISFTKRLYGRFIRGDSSIWDLTSARKFIEKSKAVHPANNNQLTEQL